MAKFAIVFLAALAFQAASAGVLMNQRYQGNTLGEYQYGLQYHGYPTGKFDALFGQLQTVSQDLTVYFQKALPNDRLVIKTLTWQSRELAHYIDTVIERLQAEAHKYSGEVSMVLGHFISELRNIQMQFHQIAQYTTDVYAVSQLKNQFYMNVQRTVVQLEKLVRLVQTVDFQQTQGELYTIVKNVVTDFLYAFQNIYSHVQYYGVYAEHSPRQVVFQIEEITSGLTSYLQGLTHFDAHRRFAVREYVQHVEAIISRMQQVEGTYGNVEIDAVFQQVYTKLRRVLAPFMQMIETESMDNVEVIRSQLIAELRFVAEAFEQLVQYAQAGKYQTFLVEILGDYIYAIQQFRMQMQSGYESHYGLYQGGFYGKTGYPGFFGQSAYQGLYQHAGLYGKSSYQGLYQHAGLYGKTGYQGLYHYGGLYGKSGYGMGFYGKYQGFAKYGQDLKQFEVQIQTIIRDLYQVFQTVSFDDVTVRQNFIHLIREYAQQLEVIVERLHQYVNYNAETDVVMFQQVAQNLRQYVLALQQFYRSEYSSTELSTQFYMYVQKIATEFEKLISGFEQTHGSFYTLVQEVLVQYMTATHHMYRMMENINQVPQYAYARQYYGDNYSAGQYSGKYFGGKFGQYYGQQGQVYETPRELVNQIEYVARDLSATFQQGKYFSQEHVQLFSMQARHFAKIIKNVIVQLEAYEHIDTVVQQVIYKLREVQLSFERLYSYTAFTNVHQLSAEFDSYIHIAVAQIEKLALIAHEETHGDFYHVIKSVFRFFLYGLHDIHYQIQQVAQYGQGYGYGKYGQQYGFPKYGQQYGFSKYFNKDGQQYEISKYFNKDGQQYGFGKYFGKYGQQFDQEYKFDKYSHGLLGLGQYGKGYGYGFQNQYGYQQLPYARNWASTQYNQDAIRAY